MGFGEPLTQNDLTIWSETHCGLGAHSEHLGTSQHLKENAIIPQICQFCYTATLFRPVKRKICDNLAKIGQCGPKICLNFTFV